MRKEGGRRKEEHRLTSPAVAILWAERASPPTLLGNCKGKGTGEGWRQREVRSPP